MESTEGLRVIASLSNTSGVLVSVIDRYIMLKASLRFSFVSQRLGLGWVLIFSGMQTFRETPSS